MAMTDWQGLTLIQARQKISTHAYVLEQREILHMLNTLKLNTFDTKPEYLKLGDVYMNLIVKHPVLIIKVKDNIAYGVALTTEESYVGILMKSNSRFYPDSYITSTMITIDASSIRLHGVYDCPSDLRELKKLLKQYYKKLLNI
jgi:hypothetical protein